MATIPELLKIIDLHGEVAELGLDLDGVMNFVVGKVVELAGADGAAIELATDEAMVYRAVAGTAVDQLGARVRHHGSLSGECLRTGQALVCDDALEDPRVDREACLRVGLRSMVVVPLTHEGQHVGVLKAMAGEPRRFDATHAALLCLLSRVVGTTMYWATRYGGDDLFHQATHDSLTDLANRSLFMDRLRHAVSQAERLGCFTAVVLLDMDALKAINDGFGHAAGDAALVEFARRIDRVARAEDTVARLGGDEFAILLDRVGAVSDVERVMDRLARELAAPFPVDGTTLSVQGSAGFAVCPLDGLDPTVLLACADHRMYEAKRARKGLVGPIPDRSAD